MAARRLADAEWAAALVHRRLRPQEAGLYAGDVALLAVANVVGGTNFCVNLDPEFKHHICPLATKRFHGSSGRLDLGPLVAGRPRVTALVFGPGSVQIVGAQNSVVLLIALHRIALMLRAHGRQPHMLFVSNDNCVARGAINAEIQLERLHECLLGFDTLYEPERFPGMICLPHDNESGAVMMMFETGCVTALGISSLDVANRKFLELATIARTHARGQALAGQLHKSSERQARCHSEERAQHADPMRRSARRKSGATIIRALQSFTTDNADLRGTPDYNRLLSMYTDALCLGGDAVATMRRRAEHVLKFNGCARQLSAYARLLTQQIHALFPSVSAKQRLRLVAHASAGHASVDDMANAFALAVPLTAARAGRAVPVDDDSDDDSGSSIL